MPIRYLDPRIYFAFKRVFIDHPDLLKSLLNALLPLPDDGLIDTLEYLTPEQVPEVPGLFKNSIVDVKCKDSQGRIFIVEMQMLWTASFSDDRFNYGEQRFATVGWLNGRMVVVAWTPRGEVRRIISMRKANEREQARYTPLE